MVDQHMEENKALMNNLICSINGAISSIRRPVIQAHNFEIKSVIIQMIQWTVQLGWVSQEDPNVLVANLLKICDTFKDNRLIDDVVRLKPFSFLLKDKVKIWLNSSPPGVIMTWNKLAQRLLVNYFPFAQTVKLRNEITTFIQYENDSLYVTWERYKKLLRKCHHHDLPAWL